MNARWKAVVTAMGLALASLTLSAPANAEPASAPAAADRESAALEAMVNKRFPRPGMVREKHRQLALPRTNGNARAAAATIVCTAASTLARVTIPGTNFFQAVGTASTDCPVPIDYVGAQARLFVFVPDLNRYELVGIGSLGFQTKPALQATSTTSANCQAREFLVYGQHEVRLGTQKVTGETFGEGAGAFLCL